MDQGVPESIPMPGYSFKPMLVSCSAKPLPLTVGSAHQELNQAILRMPVSELIRSGTRPR